jgi:hypothetical protein
MTEVKIIYWRNDMVRNAKGERFANVHLLVEYTNETITAFQGMAAEMRKTFPDVTDDKIRCGKVRKSRSVENFSIICLDNYLPEGDYPDWRQNESGTPEYYL